MGNLRGDKIVLIHTVEGPRDAPCQLKIWLLLGYMIYYSKHYDPLDLAILDAKRATARILAHTV